MSILEIKYFAVLTKFINPNCLQKQSGLINYLFKQFNAINYTINIFRQHKTLNDNMKHSKKANSCVKTNVK